MAGLTLEKNPRTTEIFKRKHYAKAVNFQAKILTMQIRVFVNMEK